jgi:hypothetical protein
MTNFSNFTRTVTAAVGALVLSTAFVTAAVGPAASAGAGSYAGVQTSVAVQEQQA